MGSEVLTPAPAKGLRYRVGMAFILMSLIFPLLALGVPLLGLSEGASATLVGLFLIGGPEICIVVGVALAGKEALETFKSFFRRWFRRMKPSRPVGRTRYRVGLAMLVAGNLALIGLAYAPLLTGVEITGDPRLLGTVSADLLILVSFFVLGEQFWGKLRRLFTWEPAQ